MPSTVLSDMQYDPAQRRLIVTFRPTGRRYTYAGVPPETYESLRRAFSKGSFFNRHIRGHYPATLLDAPDGDSGDDPGPTSPTVAGLYRPTVTRG